MRPVVLLHYESIDTWTTGRIVPARDEPHLENASLTAAYNVELSELALDERTRYAFGSIRVIGPRQVYRLSLARCSASVTGAISRNVVGRVLAGKPVINAWPLQIVYRDQKGRPLKTCFEIRLVRFPLELRSARVRCPDYSDEGDS
jgi:hypothetical protein